MPKGNNIVEEGKIVDSQVEGEGEVIGVGKTKTEKLRQ